MDAKEYFGSSAEDFEIENRNSVQMNEMIVPERSEDGHEKIHHPQPVLQSDPCKAQYSLVDSPFQDGGKVVRSVEDPHPAQASREDFFQYFFIEGNWTDLFATSANWMLLVRTMCNKSMRTNPLN